jgi:hypothetical protein
MSTWYPYNVVLMRSQLAPENSSKRILYHGNPLLVQSNFGIKGNFEVVSPFNRFDQQKQTSLCEGGLVHFIRNNDVPSLPWNNFTSLRPFPNASTPPPASDDFKFQLFENITLVQSNFGSDDLMSPANFEVIARIGDRLKHIWRESKYPFYWKKTSTYIKINYSNELTGVTGNPCLIQSKFGHRKMNFELAAPLEGGGIYHLYKIHDGEAPHLSPWLIGNGRRPLDPSKRYDAITFIQSSYGQHQNPGHLILIARSGDTLYYFWLDSGNPTTWNGPFPILVENNTIKRIQGIPSLIQSTFGIRGNFELVIPSRESGFLHYFRDNDQSGISSTPWRMGNGGNSIGSKVKYDSLSIIQSNFKRLDAQDGNLEVIALSSDGSLHHFWMDSVTKVWDGPYDIASF